MRKISIIIFMIMFLSLNSCFLAPPGAPHRHNFKLIDNLKSDIHLSVSCTQFKKYYNISGLNKNDNVTIGYGKIKDNKFYHLEKYSTDSTQVFFQKINDYNFHRNILSDTLKINIIEPNQNLSNYKFIIIDDDFLKS